MSYSLMKKLLVPSLLVLLAGCTGNDAAKKGVVTVEKGDESEITIDQDFVLPQPITLAQAFHDAGLSWQTGMINSTSRANTYALETDRILNLGVYSTDLAYCTLNNKPQEAGSCLVAIRTLAKKTGLESIYNNKDLTAKFEKDLGNPSELEDLIYEIQERSETYLENNNLRHIAAIQFAGAWLEGMYLGCDKALSEGGKMSTALYDQMTLLQNTVKGLQAYKHSDERLRNVTKGFTDIYDTWTKFDSVEKAGKNKNFEAPTLTSAEISTLVVKIRALRNAVVEPSV